MGVNKMDVGLPLVVLLGVPCTIAALLGSTWGIKRFLEEVQAIQAIIKDLRKGGG
jgi:hypothetical protein